MEQPVVTRDQFSRLTRLAVPEPLPPPARRWSEAEWAVIRRGHRPQDMDDFGNPELSGPPAVWVRLLGVS